MKNVDEILDDYQGVVDIMDEFGIDLEEYESLEYSVEKIVEKDIKKLENEFNSNIIQNNIKEAKENSLRGLSGFLNNLVYNETSMANFKDTHADEIDFFNRLINSKSLNKDFEGLNVRNDFKTPSYQLKNVYADGIFNLIDENGNIRKTTISDYYDKELRGNRLFCKYAIDENVNVTNIMNDLKLARDLTIKHGSIYKAIEYSQKYDPRNKFAILNIFNLIKGDQSIEDVDYSNSGYTDAQNTAVKNTQIKLKEEYIKSASKDVRIEKLENKIDSVLNILIYRLAIASLNIIIDKIMEVTGELLFKDPEKSWIECVKDSIKKDSVKKLVSKLYNNVKDFLIGPFKRFFDVLKYPLEFLKQLVTVIIGSIGILAMNVYKQGVTKVIRLTIKGLQAGWSFIKMAKALYDAKNEIEFKKRYSHIRESIKSLIRVFVDLADIIIEYISKELNIGSLVNIILYLICEFISFIYLTVLDSMDNLLVNTVNRFNYVIDNY